MHEERIHKEEAEARATDLQKQLAIAQHAANEVVAERLSLAEAAGSTASSLHDHSSSLASGRGHGVLFLHPIAIRGLLPLNVPQHVVTCLPLSSGAQPFATHPSVAN